MVSLDASVEVIIPEVIKRDRRVERMPATLDVGLPVVVGIVWLCVPTVLRGVCRIRGGMSPFFVFGEVGILGKNNNDDGVRRVQNIIPS